MQTNNNWMEDPALAGIDRAKLSFLGKLFLQGSAIDASNKKEMMSFLVSLSKLSKENNISFDKEEVQLIYSVLKKYANPDDLPKMQQLSSFFHSP